MKKILLATIIAVTAAVGPSHTQQTTPKDQLIGSWKVLSLKATTGDKVTYPLGEQVVGYVTITPTRFWLLFVDATRKAPAAPAPDNSPVVGTRATYRGTLHKVAVPAKVPISAKLEGFASLFGTSTSIRRSPDAGPGENVKPKFKGGLLLVGEFARPHHSNHAMDQVSLYLREPAH